MSDFLPEDLIQNILLELPSNKSLVRCMAVCKSWRSLIKSSTFALTHLQRKRRCNKENDDLLLVMVRKNLTEEPGSMLCSLHWENPEFAEYSKLDYPFSCYHDHLVTEVQPQLGSAGGETIKLYSPLWRGKVVGTCNGLVCLLVGSLFEPETVIIWNPCVRKYVVLPKPNDTWSLSYAFGYDSRTNDYIVVRINKRRKKDVHPVEVWSLSKRECWKSFSATAVPEYFAPENYDYVFLNDAFHWVQPQTGLRTCSITSFHMVSESFGEIRIPQRFPRILKYGESLALFDKDYKCPGVYDFHLWVMKEYGVAESLTKLFSIRLEEHVVRPLFIRESGEVVIQMPSGVVVTVDPKTLCINDFSNGVKHRDYFINSFVESLVLLGEANAISY